MRILTYIIASIMIGFSSEKRPMGEIKDANWLIEKAEESESDKNALWLSGVSQAHWKGIKSLSNKDITRIESLYTSGGESNRMQALGVLVTVYDIREASKLYNDSLASNSKKEIQQVLNLLYNHLKSANDSDKNTLINYVDINNKIKEINESHADDKFIKNRVEKISGILEKHNSSLDQSLESNKRKEKTSPKS